MSDEPCTDTNTVGVQFAAGGVLWREIDGERRLAVVHRPRYDDWTLPKGKPEGDEPLDETALREVHEETGYLVDHERFAGTVGYETDAGPKVVLFWLSSPVDGSDEPDDEVDEVRWLAVDEALDRLSYPAERALLRRRPVNETLASPNSNSNSNSDAESTDRNH
jgi:8-oxo-dGTP diphosphatase